MYKICTRCVMDNKSDPCISFEKDGTCNYCNEALKKMPNRYFPNEEGRRKLDALIVELKEKNKSQKYDCFMGLSGGLDSSYLAHYVCKEYGLRVLAIHIDDGFDTEISKRNITRLVEKYGIDLINITPNKEQYYALTLAFIKAGVPNIAIPQDNVLFSSLYKYMEENNIEYFLSGGNFSLESILQRGYTHDAYDRKHIFDINRRFGSTALDKLPILSRFQKEVVLPRKKKIITIYPLDYIKYERDAAWRELQESVGFEYYGAKHWESKFTKFMQTYYLYKKFGVDKRKSHLSSMIISNQISRDECLKELSDMPYQDENIRKDIQDICALLGITPDEMEHYVTGPGHEHGEYATSKNLWKYPLEIERRIKKFLKKK